MYAGNQLFRSIIVFLHLNVNSPVQEITAQWIFFGSMAFFGGRDILSYYFFHYHPIDFKFMALFVVNILK